MNEQYIKNFIEYQYKPLSKSQLFARMIVVWIICGIGCVVGKEHLLCVTLFLGISVGITLSFVFILRKGVERKNSKFLCDTVTYSYFSVALSFLAYRVFTWNSGDNIALGGLLILVLFATFATSGIVVICNIKSNRYEGTSIVRSNSILPYLLAALGMLLAREYFSGTDSDAGLFVIALSLMLLSILVGFGWTNLFRLVLNQKTKR